MVCVFLAPCSDMVFLVLVLLIVSGQSVLATSQSPDHCESYLSQQLLPTNGTMFQIQHDDYCDCPLFTGILEKEESFSSACSFYTVGKMTFHCKKAGGSTHTHALFASRVNDGTCDCCDGSDEDPNQNGGIFCPDKCETDIAEARRTALLWHRTVQAGKHKRQDLLNDLERKRRKELATFSNLQDQLKDLDSMVTKITKYLFLHSPREQRHRFGLVRERLFNCINGIHERCSFFFPDFFDDDELPDYALPDNSKVKWKPRPKCIHSDAEKRYMNSLTGLNRVRATLCDKESLFRDDTYMIATTTGELVSFLDSPNGKNTVKVFPHENTLYGRFLDEGEYGYVMGLMFLGEWAAIFALPLTGTIYALDLGFKYIQSKLWSAITTCAALSREELVLVPNFVLSACRSAQNVDVPGTAESSLANLLDPSSYSVLAKIYDRVEPLIKWPRRLARLARYAPEMYYKFYFTSASQALPAARLCCLLRAGLSSARDELYRMATRLKEEKELRDAVKSGDELTYSDSNLEEEKEDDEGDSFDGDSTEKKSVPKKRKSSTRRSKKSEREKKAELLDYGLLKEWEAVKGLCLEKDEGSYHYKFCFFKEIKQGSTLLGRFSGWGAREEVIMQDTSRRKGSKRSREKLLETEWVADGLNSLGLSSADPIGLDRSSQPARTNNYTTQFYGNGARCAIQKRSRSVQVMFTCSTEHSISQIIETDICVYDMQILTPMACTEAVENESLDILDKLGVFGYTQAKN